MTPSPKRIALLGSTGSIGLQTLDVVRRLPERLRITALAAGSSTAVIGRQALDFSARHVALDDCAGRDLLTRMLPPGAFDLQFGPDALEHVAVQEDVDIVVVAVAGSVGTRATIAALRAGKDVALATKEVLVAAGGLVREAAALGGGRILPIDSEHSAIFQCLQGHAPENVRKLWLTASGGPFRGYTQEQLERVTTGEALNHPTWRMGPKVTIDSATLMNKGLETIEARWLFDVPPEQIEVVVHPQSVIHSMVEMVDGSLLAQLGLPDMRLPIEYALLYPDRADLGADLPRLDPRQMSELTFEAPDSERFPCLRLARAASKTGGTMPAVLNAANESAVELFLNGRIRFVDIAKLIDSAMQAHCEQLIAEPSLDQVLAADAWARGFAVDDIVGTGQTMMWNNSRHNRNSREAQL